MRAVELMWSRCDSKSLLCIFVRRIQGQYQFLTARGTWMHVWTVSFKTFYRVHSYVDASDLKPIMPYMPSTEVPDGEVNLVQSARAFLPPKACATLMDRMRRLNLESNETYRLHAHRIEDAHKILADEEQDLYMDITDLAARLLDHSNGSTVPDSATWAIYQALRHYAVGIVVTSTTREKPGPWKILSHHSVALMKSVQTWLREHQEQAVLNISRFDTSSKPSESSDFAEPPLCNSKIVQFARWARPLIEQSRTHRQAIRSHGVGPFGLREMTSGQQMSLHESPKAVRLGQVEEPHLSILKFLHHWAVLDSIFRHDSLAAVGPMILQAVGVYGDEPLDRRTGKLFLRELGFISDLRGSVEPHTILALPRQEPPNAAGELLEESDRAARNFAAQDSMQHLRQDWGNLEVFCIDAADTQEVDDGFSFETIEGDDDSAWIHVHVANPTAFIPRSHPSARYAEHLYQSIYLAGQKYGMLPATLVAQHFSLDAGRPVLTFSARVSNQGEILETRVASGRVRNVVFATPDALAKVFRTSTTAIPLSFSHSVGLCTARAGRSNLTEEFTLSQIRTLRKLRDFTFAAHKRRMRDGAFDYPSHAGHVDPVVYNALVPKVHDDNLYQYRGDPTIVHAGHVFDPTSVNDYQEYWESLRIVQNIMTVACEATGMWCSQRRIPLAYRGTRHNHLAPPIADFREKLLQPLTEEVGYLPADAVGQFARLYAQVMVSPTPQRHQLLAIDAYVQCTSPLRRYGDMLCHWQIEAALRHEASLTDPLSSTSGLKLAFSPDEVKTICERASQREIDIARVRLRERSMRTSELLFRKFYFREGDPLPDTFTAYISSRRYSNRVRCVLCEMNMEAKVLTIAGKEAAQGPPAGSLWMARIVEVDMMTASVGVELISRME